MGIFGGTADLVTRFYIELRMGLVMRDPETGQYNNPNEELESTAFRARLDAGLCDNLFDEILCLELVPKAPYFPDHKMFTVMLAVMVMQSGAKIRDDNMQHLRNIVPLIADSASAPKNEGFTDRGREQFLAALQDYNPGTPHTFQVFESTETRSVPGRLAVVCGKIEADTGKFFSFCTRCMTASHCDQVGTPGDYPYGLGRGVREEELRSTVL